MSSEDMVERPRWTRKYVWQETVVQETVLENGTKVIMHLHFGEYDMADFMNWCALHPVARVTWSEP